MSVPWYLMAKGKGGGGYKTASGPIVSINDALAAPLRSLVANIDPVQDLHGYDSPWPAGGGKNLLDPDKMTTYGSGYGRRWYYDDGITLKANQAYTLSVSGTSQAIRLYIIDKASGTKLSEGSASTTYTSAEDTLVYLQAYRNEVIQDANNFQLEQGSTATTYAPYSNVCPISGWTGCKVWVKPTYDPTANPTATLQLGQTVYGGTLDVTNGVLTVDRAYWTKNTSTMDNASAYPGWKNAGIKALGYSGSSVARNVVMNIGTLFSYNCTENNDILFLSTSYYGKTQEKWMALAIDVQILVPLATPITIPLTATQISTLQGQNNLWADSGDVTLEYLSSGGTDPDLMKLAVAFMGRKYDGRNGA